MRTIMLLNAKGGCGKSTLATNLAAHYANQQASVVLADMDPQGSSMEWLAARPQERAAIKGVAAWEDSTKIPRNADYVIFDAPAGTRGKDLTAMVRRVQTIVIPVLPSATDIRATARFVHDVLLLGRIERRQSRVAVVANRVRETGFVQNKMEQALGSIGVDYASTNTHIYRGLDRFLSRLKIPFITTLRDTPNYQLADEQGLGVCELDGRARYDVDQWQPLIKWLDSRRSMPVD